MTFRRQSGLVLRSLLLLLLLLLAAVLAAVRLRSLEQGALGLASLASRRSCQCKTQSTAELILKLSALERVPLRA